MRHQLGNAVPVTVADIVAGFAVDDDVRGFRFVAIDPRFRVLEGSRFHRLEQARLAACRMARVVLPEQAFAMSG